MKNSDKQIIIDLDPCSEGRVWALAQPDLKAVWDNCERPDWLFWLLDKLNPLSPGISIRIAVASAERSLANFEKLYPGDKRPREAIASAKTFAENPTEENRSAARSAAESAEHKWQCDLIRSLVPNPFFK